jgi:DNA-directed RNA polymerase subunit M/transcription elongation factor TFIIS
MTSGEKQPNRPIFSAIRRTCPKCGDEMVVELLRSDTNDTPVPFLVCHCGHWEKPAADIEADMENRPRMPGF